MIISYKPQYKISLVAKDLFEHTPYPRTIIDLDYLNMIDYSSLYSLNLSYLKIDNFILKMLLRKIKNVKTLKKLNLSYNKITSQGIKDLSNFIAENTTLEEIDITKIDIHYDDLKTLFDALTKNYSLLKLELNERPPIQVQYETSNLGQLFLCYIIPFSFEYDALYQKIKSRIESNKIFHFSKLLHKKYKIDLCYDILHTIARYL